MILRFFISKNLEFLSKMIPNDLGTIFDSQG